MDWACEKGVKLWPVAIQRPNGWKLEDVVSPNSGINGCTEGSELQCSSRPGHQPPLQQYSMWILSIWCMGQVLSNNRSICFSNYVCYGHGTDAEGRDRPSCLVELNDKAQQLQGRWTETRWLAGFSSLWSWMFQNTTFEILCKAFLLPFRFPYVFLFIVNAFSKGSKFCKCCHGGRPVF